MEIITNYDDKEEWNKFVADNTSPASFLQSFEWGEFREKYLDEKALRLVVKDGQEILMAAQFTKKTLPGGRFYLNCARGPVVEKSKIKNQKSKLEEIFGLIQLEIKKIAEQEKIVFVRIELPYEKNYELSPQGGSPLGRRITDYELPKILTSLKEPIKTEILDLEKSEQELLEAMHQKTRYNIRLAEKKGVKIKWQMANGKWQMANGERGTKNKDVEIFYKLSQETAKRDGIKIYSKDYYEKLVEFFGDNKKQMKLKLYVAEYEGKPLASIMVIYFGDTATYLYGASSNENRELMPNYLIQWQAIKDAKSAGMKIYDFWGIDEEKWPGITRFKKGFGGEEVEFMGARDYVLNRRWYNIFHAVKFLKGLLPTIKIPSSKSKIQNKSQITNNKKF
jgi:peptidoglycan pentaglycine glycine transferase (the first glycine)